MAEPAYALAETEFPQSARWPVQGQWSWEDYLRLPDDSQRYEILEGVLYVSPAPSYDHQFSVYELAAELRNFVKARRLGVVLGAPFDVRLPGVANPVQPDLLFFRTGNEPHTGDKYFEGVPDLIVEVLSPGSIHLDQRVKFDAYQKVGVPEYWVVAPMSRSITVYHFHAGRREYQKLGHFGADETLHSVVLPGFAAAVGSLFPAPKS
ncbi:MAG: Uma2 family endonuclease [bacterium]|nr:Uma2 family endonuclease [bacterium]